MLFLKMQFIGSVVKTLTNLMSS